MAQERAAKIALLDAQDEEIDRRAKAYEATRPQRPEALRWQRDDTFALGRSSYDRTTWVGEDDMEAVYRHHASNKRAFEGYGVNRRWKERGDQVIAAWSDWKPRDRAAYEAAGIPEAELLGAKLDGEVHAVEARIMALPATTVEGLKVKAAIARRYGGGLWKEDLAERHIFALMRDLCGEQA